MLRKLLSLAFCASFVTGCAAQVGVSGPMKIPSDGLAQCQSQCAQMGMGTGAVVVMANQTDLHKVACSVIERSESDHTSILHVPPASLSSTGQAARP